MVRGGRREAEDGRPETGGSSRLDFGGSSATIGGFNHGPFVGARGLMVFEQIEKLKRQYTDKYVIVDDSLPELRRFKGLTGTVKTVNMSGRALVEFDGLNNIGWYDIELDCLKVIDQPLPKAEEKPAKQADKPAKAEAPAKAAKPAAAPAEKKPAASGPKMSVAEMLAAARAKGGGAAAPAAKADTPKAAPAAPAKEKPAPAAKAPAATPAKIDPKKLSVAEMLAMARGGSSAAKPAAPAAPPAAKEEVAEEPAAVKSEEVAVEPTVASPASSPKKLAAGAKPTSVADIVAYCRKADAK